MAKKLPKKSKGVVGAKAPCKRPASTEPATSSVASQFKSSLKSRVYSTAYHRATREAVKSGRSPDEAAKAARLAAQKKVFEADAMAQEVLRLHRFIL